MNTLGRILFAATTVYFLVSLILSIMVSLGVYRYEIITHRCPFTIMEVSIAKAEFLDSCGNVYGFDQHGEYIGFERYCAGAKVVTVFLWNAYNNACDDRATREDVLFIR